MSLRIVDLFRPAVKACWITTYNLDLGLFDSFLYPKLGDPPINAVVLTDGHQHDRVLEEIPADEDWRVQRVNRRWLLRPVHDSAAFHPKTLLFVDSSAATLLVGSGNLSVSGLDRGHEVFTTFSTHDAVGREAIASWVAWTEQLIRDANDELLNRRFTHLISQLPALPAPGNGFVHNLTTPLLQQFVARLEPPVAELHLTAPFFDRDLRATAELIETTSPQKLWLYLAADASLDGQRLQQVLQASNADVHLQLYGPDRFVHAKLVGAIGQDGTGFLLSGSANLSLAALASSVDSSAWANYETGVIARLDPDTLRGTFTNPPPLEATPTEPAAFIDQRFRSDDIGSRPPIHLRTARRRGNGSLELHYTGELPAAALLTDGNTTIKPNSDEQLEGRLVWLVVDTDPISNRCVVAEPSDLDAQLRTPDSKDLTRPGELHAGDLDTPLGRVLQWMHETCIMDVAETDAVGIAERAAEDTENEGDETDLWNRLASDNLQYDPRASTYQLVQQRAGADDPLLGLLSAMLSRAPEQVHQAWNNVIALPTRQTDGDQHTGDERPREDYHQARRWAVATRVRVRARNVLRRWADAIGDRRLAWIDPHAPLVNYRAMIDAIAMLRSINQHTGDGLKDEDLDDLTDRTVRAILAAWPHLEHDEEGTLPDRTVALATALVYLALRDAPDKRSRFLHWQPRLRDLREHGILQPSSLAANYLTVLLERPTIPEQIRFKFEEAITYIDDEEWTRRQREQLNFTRLVFGKPKRHDEVDAVLFVEGITRPLMDPRTLQLIAAALDYRDAGGLRLNDRREHWSLTILPGERLTLHADWLTEGAVDSLSVLGVGELERLAASDSPLSELFAPQHRAA